MLSVRGSLGAMLEPRYTSTGVGGGSASTGGRLLEPNTSAASAVEDDVGAAMDLSRKPQQHHHHHQEVDSEEEAPLDLKVRPDSGKSLFPGLSSVPGPQQRAELLRIAELYTSNTALEAATTPLPPPPSSRDSSQERDPSEHSCNFCGGDKLSDIYDPAEHAEGVCNRGSIACTLCPKTFTLYSHYEAHKRSHGKLNKQRQYPCATCQKVFTSASNRNMHQRIHKGVRPFRCVPCGVFFRQKAHLQKHQKTQGHVQATDIYEKKRRDGGGVAPNNNEHDEEQESVKSEDTNSSYEHQNLLVDSTSTLLLAAQHVDSSSADEKSPSSSTSTRSRSKSSPKRKQARPQYLEPSVDTCEADCGEEDRVKAFVEYNDMTHGYECRQCAFASHELASIKAHAKEEHLEGAQRVDLFRCDECQLGFSKEFHLRVHSRKHEAGGEILPCDLCDHVFKAPNKLLKHLEMTHSVCPTCGERCDGPTGLDHHLTEFHGDELRKGFLAQLNLKAIPQALPQQPMLPLGPMTALNILAQTAENRAAKMRKVDSLAETIRQRQQQQHNTSNGNEPGYSSHHEHDQEDSPLRRRKTDMSTVKAMLAKTPEPMMNTEHILRKSENNNILSNLKLLPPSIRLPTQPVAGLTPPSSPPPPPSTAQVSVTIVPHHLAHVQDSDSEMDEDDSPAGLDLSMHNKKPSGHHSSDENEVSTTNKDLDLPRMVLPGGIAPGSATHPFPPFPFPFSAGLLPQVPTHPGVPPATDLTEHLLKLGIPRGLAPSAPAPLPPPPSALNGKPSLPSAAYTSVLSAMLGHNPYQPVFPGMPAPPPPSSAAGALFPTSTSTPHKEKTVDSSSLPLLAAAAAAIQQQQNLVPSSSASTTSSTSDSSKPFHCSYCTKEFAHLSSLESHMEHMHSGEAKHVCESCGKNFSSKSNLTAHKKIHSGERPFVCGVCHKRFRQKAHLQKHETTHSSATPYHCTMCDKAFGHPSNLSTHMATHSNIRPHTCKDCGKSYKDSASFKRHRLTHGHHDSNGNNNGGPVVQHSQQRELEDLDDEMDEGEAGSSGSRRDVSSSSAYSSMMESSREDDVAAGAEVGAVADDEEIDVGVEEAGDEEKRR